MNSQDQTALRSPLSGYFVSVCLLGLLLSAIGGLIAWLQIPSTSQLLVDAQRAYRRRDFPAAESYAKQVISRDQTLEDAALIAGDSAAQQAKFDAALQYLDLIPDDGSSSAVAARLQAGDLYCNRKKLLSAAIGQFRRTLAQDPGNHQALERMGYLLGLTGDDWEAAPYRLQLISQEQFGPVHLLLLCMGNFVDENPEELSAFQTANPEDPLVLIAQARQLIEQQQVAQAVAILRPIVWSQPDLLLAEQLLGQALLAGEDSAAFQEWCQQLPANAHTRPGIWVIQAAWLQKYGQHASAIRCYLEAIRRDANLQVANYQLGQLLSSAGDSESAAPFLERSGRLQKYDTAVRAAWSRGGLEADMQLAASLADELELVWEAYGWSFLAGQRYPAAEWAQLRVSRLKGRLQQLSFSRTQPDCNPVRNIDISRFPLPDWKGMAGETAPGQSAPSSLSSQVSFADQAAEAGLRFQYYNSSDPLHPTRKMQEFTGGGVAVLDYDADGHPDVYFTQGTSWPPRSEDLQHLDQFFRNTGEGHFQNVTLFARLAENRFGQGVTVGDYDNDGFADLFVANIGCNRLYRNNGDGTYADVTADAGVSDQRWTTSCVVADLNGDSLPDIYAVNYLAEPEALERICQDEAGHPRSCMPRIFSGAQDQLWVNRGDGGFEDGTQAAGLVRPDGKGLGLVAADFSGTGRLDLFVANDAVPNFFFVNQTSAGSTQPVFAERGLQAGLALNADGRAQACMGVAAGNLDNDRQLALLVTNFHNEANTLYRRQGADVYVDDTRRSGLYAASLPMVGFGTQFLDAELDGQLDLIVVNGDVDDSRDVGRLYQMPPQFFANAGHGQFTELSADQLGPYFHQQSLGRGLARLDWNQDGREDVVVTHLDRPAALLTNTSATDGHYLEIQLRAVQSSRDAIGAMVTVAGDDLKLTRQLTAGDGYQASNERQLHFGLGPHPSIEQLTVTWPSGQMQQFRDVPADSRILLIEGQDHLWKCEP